MRFEMGFSTNHHHPESPRFEAWIAFSNAGPFLSNLFNRSFGINFRLFIQPVKWKFAWISHL
jgi:hypothetical protein